MELMLFMSVVPAILFLSIAVIAHRRTLALYKNYKLVLEDKDQYIKELEAGLENRNLAIVELQALLDRRKESAGVVKDMISILEISKSEKLELMRRL